MNQKDDEEIPDHKLCGYLRVIVAVLPHNAAQSLSVNTGCRISGDGADAHFVSQNGVVLRPIDSTTALASRKKWSRIGMVNGSLSVVRQLHTLLLHKCLSILARVVGVSSRDALGDLEVRAVVLVDVYLPIALWSGWQFPKYGPAAAALIKHLSCDWEARRLMHASCGSELEDNSAIWDLFDCHVLGCSKKCHVPDASQRKTFELPEIFNSLPSLTIRETPVYSKICQADASTGSGIWLVPDDIMLNILVSLRPIDLVRIAATCHHLRSLAAPIMPCMKLKLFPHQKAAVEWMLERERDSEACRHPLFKEFTSKDGFSFYVNVVSGEITMDKLPLIKDFRGGMFCDEPGLGKTITSLSLILKTQGTLADPPDGVQVIWCMSNSDQRCGYYEITSEYVWNDGTPAHNKAVGPTPRRGLFSLNELSPSQNSCFLTPKNGIFILSNEQIVGSTDSFGHNGIESQDDVSSKTEGTSVWSSMSRCHIRRNLLNAYLDSSNAAKRKHGSGTKCAAKPSGGYLESSHNGKKRKRTCTDFIELHETWIQCDACGKWRKLLEGISADPSRAWFCSMNTDPAHQNCEVLEEPWDYESIKILPGFHTKGAPGSLTENISFFTSVLREHSALMNLETKKVLTWFVKLLPEKLSQMETVGIAHPVAELCMSDRPHNYHKIFQAFGLVKKVKKRITRWYYPKSINNLSFDVDALKAALCQPLDLVRLYLSRATLIVVPSNLVDHWKSQIEKHVRPGQLKVYLWTDHKRPLPHHLAWDYDIVITTFNRLSAEWNPKKRSALMQVHWLRVLLDEGHTLGSSLTLTNKLQMAVFLRASRRWVLTGTPTPNTPSSQISHLHPMLKFLHDEAYGLNQKSWEDGIIRPFEAEMEEGRLRLLQLLQRCMICARKRDVQSIPSCNKKVTYLDFTGEYAKSYNELVETVRRNILFADWNDSNHVESLLNSKQWKFRSATIRNVRLSCCVAGHMRVTDAGQDIQETMDILQVKGLDPATEEYALIRYNLLHGGHCLRCQAWCRLPVITPCSHVLCLDCIALDKERCTVPSCGNLYEMQSPEKRSRPENPNPQWPVPKDLIELQPSYKQDDWHPDWLSTSSTKVSYLVERLKVLREACGRIASFENKKGPRNTDEVNYPFQRYSLCSTLQEQCYKEVESSRTNPVKVIIFSQFLEHINVIEQQLTVAGIQFAAMYSPMPLSDRMKSLGTFQSEMNCMALLMDGSAALGLDLSFVTHVFLMEPVWDKSMEEQVISRAHRMGAKCPINVEILAMKGTIEEQMTELLQDPDKCRKMLEKERNKHDGDGQRAHRTFHDFAEYNYLRELSFVRRNSRV